MGIVSGGIVVALLMDPEDLGVWDVIQEPINNCKVIREGFP
mgnify:CR=1 FL=1